jgi:hypothetical protein
VAARLDDDEKDVDTVDTRGEGSRLRHITGRHIGIANASDGAHMGK